jgi:hypothetical protein
MNALLDFLRLYYQVATGKLPKPQYRYWQDVAGDSWLHLSDRQNLDDPLHRNDRRNYQACLHMAVIWLWRAEQTRRERRLK